MIRRLGQVALLLFAVCLAPASCRTVSSSGLLGDDDDQQLSSDEVAGTYSAILHDPAAQSAFTALRAMTFPAYYDVLVVSQRDDAEVAIDAMTFPRVEPPTAPAKAAFLKLYTNFPTVGDYWTAIGFEPSQATIADVKQALTMAYEFQTQAGGFAPDAYKPEGAAFSDAAESDGLTDQAPQRGLALTGGKSAFDAKECGQLMAQVVESFVDDNRGIACTLRCQKFWQSLNKCKELLETAKVVVEELSASEIMQAKYPILKKRPILVKLGIKMSFLVVKVAPAMNQLIGFASWIYNIGKDGLNRLRNPRPDSGSDSGRDSPDAQTPDAARQQEAAPTDRERAREDYYRSGKGGI